LSRGPISTLSDKKLLRRGADNGMFIYYW